MDLIIVIILILRIVKYAKAKKLSQLKWAVLFALNWFMFELLGVTLASALLNIEFTIDFIYTNPGYAMLLSVFGICCGFLGYFMTRKMMDRASV
ncbi:MAG TPA: hypothetical protein VNW06_11710 [Cytophagaceae bacterium]|jgi:hypothetical protein|nr:hypothetical protein [Cytophagaceae bacterium]